MENEEFLTKLQNALRALAGTLAERPEMHTHVTLQGPFGCVPLDVFGVCPVADVFPEHQSVDANLAPFHTRVVLDEKQLKAVVFVAGLPRG